MPRLHLKIVAAVTLCFQSISSLMAAEPPGVTWFSLGGDVYQERDRFEAEKQVLTFDKSPRWFQGFPKEVSKSEFEAWLKSRMGSLQQQSTNEPSYQIPNPPEYARRAGDLPTQHHGASLKFAVEAAKESDEQVFVLTLTAGDRPIRREIEHRNTNVVPFLFAFQADGKAVSVELDGGSKEGGSNRLIELVPAKASQTWRLRVARKSLEGMIPANAQKLEITAAFSERQHEGYSGNELATALEFWNLKELPPQILVRSNAVRMVRGRDGWTSE